MLSVWSLPELVEAAARCGRTELAAAAVERLAERTRAAGTELALGIEARARALVSEGAAGRGASSRGDRTARRAAGSRSTSPARVSSTASGCAASSAGSMPASSCARRTRCSPSMGAEAFADRARRELLATGETVRARTPDTRDELTAQESQIAQLARGGLSNPDIAARLFISPRTVQYHLRKVFAKLDISSRNQLHAVLPDDPKAA